MLARPLGAAGKKHHGVLVTGKNIVQLSTERAPRQLGDPAKELENLSYAFVVTGQRAPAGAVPADVLGPVLIRSASMSPRPKAA